MKHPIRCLLLIVGSLMAAFTTHAQAAYDPQRLYPVEQLVSDLHYFQHQFDSIHPSYPVAPTFKRRRVRHRAWIVSVIAWVDRVDCTPFIFNRFKA